MQGGGGKRKQDLLPLKQHFKYLYTYWVFVYEPMGNTHLKTG